MFAPPDPLPILVGERLTLRISGFLCLLDLDGLRPIGDTCRRLEEGWSVQAGYIFPWFPPCRVSWVLCDLLTNAIAL